MSPMGQVETTYLVSTLKYVTPQEGVEGEGVRPAEELKRGNAEYVNIKAQSIYVGALKKNKLEV